MKSRSASSLIPSLEFLVKALPRIRSRGWPAVLNSIPAVIRQLHYANAADALIIVADSDDSPLHADGHEKTTDQSCRYCQIQEKVDFTLNSIATPGPLVAIGIAAPAIEAWYLFPDDASLSEATWRNSLGGGRRPDVRRELKKRVYGTQFPTQTIEVVKAEQAAHRLLANMKSFEDHFPNGFGPLARAVRSWRNIGQGNQ
jgi:hypothetical protein